jgi:hypothetical protein
MQFAGARNMALTRIKKKNPRTEENIELKDLELDISIKLHNT